MIFHLPHELKTEMNVVEEVLNFSKCLHATRLVKLTSSIYLFHHFGGGLDDDRDICSKCSINPTRERRKTTVLPSIYS